MEYNKYDIFVNNKVIKLNTNISDSFNSKIKEIYIKSYPNLINKVKSTKNDILIKFYNYNKLDNFKNPNYQYFDQDANKLDANKLDANKLDANKLDANKLDDTEIFLIKEYLYGKLDHPYFYNYLGLTEVINYQLKEKHNYNILSVHNIGILMETDQTLDNYLQNNIELNNKYILTNMYNMIDLCIYIKNKYSIYHCDIKIQNILVKNDKFYLIDWENVLSSTDYYIHNNRPIDGNTEMYPHYDVTSEEFFIYEIGVLLIRILGYHVGVTDLDFIENKPYDLIMCKIFSETLQIYEELIKNIFERKVKKIEELRSSIKEILDNITNG